MLPSSGPTSMCPGRRMADTTEQPEPRPGARRAACIPSLRRARDEDNAELSSLFNSVAMEGDLAISTLREPDFFGLYRMQSSSADTWVLDGAGGAIDGAGSILLRQGFLDGEPGVVGYLGDLRVRFSGRRTLGLPVLFGEVFDEAMQRSGCRACLTAVLASNTAAIRALVERRPRRAQQPYYHLLRRFDAVSVPFTLPPLPARSQFTAERAREDDVPAIKSLLASDHAQRPFGYRFDEGELEHRLAHWPGYRLENTFLAYDRSGGLVGVTTAWDACDVKRYRVDAYNGSLRVARRAYNVAAALGRFSPLPAAGHPLRYFYLCNTSIVDDDPAVLRALLSSIYRAYRGRGYHFFMLYLDEDDPLRPALKGFLSRGLRFHLYAVSRVADSRVDFPSTRTGFEMALA